MKKDLIHEIRAVANILPEKWETTMVTSTLSGADAALTVIGASPYNKDKTYQFQTPVFLRVNHESRIKDGIKMHGNGFLKTYINHVTNG